MVFWRANFIDINQLIGALCVLLERLEIDEL